MVYAAKVVASRTRKGVAAVETDVETTGWDENGDNEVELADEPTRETDES